MLCSWSNDSILAASTKAPSSILAAGNVPFANPSVMKQNFGYENPFVRKLLNESHGIFVRFLDAVKDTDPKTISAHILQNASVDFRVSIRACCQGFERALAEIDDRSSDRIENARKLESLLLLYRHIEIIWSLCDVLFFRPHGTILVCDLLEWSRWNFTEPDNMVKEMLDWQRGHGINPSANRLEQNEKYWNTIFLFLLTGRVEEARKLLRAHSRAQMEPALISMDEILRTFPLSGTSVQNPSDLEFYAWREEVKRRFESATFLAVPELETVAEILLGDDETFKRLSPLCSGWYQLVVGRAVFTQPLAKIFDLHFISEECIDLMASSQQSWSSLDKTLLSLFQLNILNALKELCSSFRNWWCAAHLGLLLWHGGCTDLLAIKQNVDLREYLLFEYGESLMTSGSSLWHIGVDYLAACPTYGINALRLTLERIPLSTKDHQKTFKVLEICQKYHLYDTAKTICKEKAISALKAGKLADSLTWSFQSKDTQFATYIADQLLRLHGNNGQLRDLAVLDNLLGETILISPSVTFLCKYRQMSVLMKQKEWKECASVLTELVSSRIAPRSFWWALFSDVMALLKADKDIFDTDQTYRLMDVLESMILDIDHMNNRNYFTNQDQLDKNTLIKNMNELRGALVKNLSTSLWQKREFMG